jgi:predicted AlkP superfamily phosphohydrolase/phosphomutase
VPGRRLTVIGLDSATLDVVRPLADAGELPGIARMLGGASGVLRSTTHPLTPHAWVTMCTGVNAGRHGVWDFLERDETGYGFTPITGAHRRAPAIWDHLSRSGRSVGLVTVPFTWPAPELHGFVVSGFDAPEGGERSVHPASLLGDVRRRFPDLRLDDTPAHGPDGRIDLDLVRRACEAKAALALWLADEFDPDLLFVVFMAADYIHHSAWPEWEQKGEESSVAEVYRILDAAVTELAAARPDSDVLLVSDHGAGPLRGAINLNGWLAQEGYLTYRPALGRTTRRLRRAARKLPWVSLGPRPVVDWGRTRAFAYGVFGNVVLNVHDRERSGIVGPSDYEDLRAEIASKALELRSDTGELIVARVHRREDLFDGPQLSKIPDLVIEFRDYEWLGPADLEIRREGVFDRRPALLGGREGWAASHRHEGLIAMTGPSCSAGRSLSAEMVDVAPTALYLLGVPVPSSLEGRLLTEALDPGPLASRPPSSSDDTEPWLAPVEDYRPEEAAAVRKRLRELGYLE